MESVSNKIDKAIGPIFGVLLAIIWVALLFLIEGILFSHQDFMDNPFIAWFNLGLVPFFVYAGNYLLYSRKLGGIETNRAVIMLKSWILCFLLWFPVLGVIYLGQYDVPDPIEKWGALLLAPVVYLAWDWSATRRKSHANAGRE
ncbi:MAG: hypothetical protein XE11_2669 [Methanomicrobiales archaeon 53_19]|nr:MAG: hypothetical protein XD88_1928 [Methanocalculus sp. 52_23]KUK99712.1 MAG: hypothetical protein XE11_2669 [Methanomicrobiales archaeon 53_19]MCK9306107.1 hypothetical protein [Methanoculleus sp.]